ncbi:cell surface protein [Reticulomyxa filosa]|uniref:Cell surface protein n=1 Tax=Reticulomyxa filosa TaxID=46433 RepID=X6MAQ1_RETFI|nr:cell surface protein [Reticulomyxa filosa]|eukprot:ETO10919.1 cell surface protein [Reticulomyxa filosa]
MLTVWLLCITTHFMGLCQSANLNNLAWPQMRRTVDNLARSSFSTATIANNKQLANNLWHYPTEKGIFSTPILSHDSKVALVGSADNNFYAVKMFAFDTDPQNLLQWKFETDDIIDSAGALLPFGTEGSYLVLIPSADGHIYAVNESDGSLRWSFKADNVKNSADANAGMHCKISGTPQGGLAAWFEGNVKVVQYDYYSQYGLQQTMIYAGCDDIRLYGLNSTGQLQFSFYT